jgi:hypothetical protein
MYRIVQTLLVISGFALFAAHETSWAQESTLDTAAVLSTKEALLPKGVTYEANFSNRPPLDVRRSRQIE